MAHGEGPNGEAAQHAARTHAPHSGNLPAAEKNRQCSSLARSNDFQ